MNRNVVTAATGMVLVVLGFVRPSQACRAEELDYFPGAEVSLPKDEVFDSFFGYFLGLLNIDAMGKIDGPMLHRVLPVFNKFFSIPIEQFLLMTRSRGSRGGVEVDLFFRQDIDLPIPYRILWDTPGSISASATIRLREVRMERVEIPLTRGQVLLAPVYAYVTTEGHASLDFDPWIDLLLGRAVDDVDIELTILFRADQRWYVGLMGRGYEGQPVVGYFDFKANRILVPVPRRFRPIGPYFMDLLLGGKGAG